MKFGASAETSAQTSTPSLAGISSCNASNVMAMANTPSLKAAMRATSLD